MSLSIDNQARIKQLEYLYTRLKTKTEKTIISDKEPENPTIGTAWFDITELAFKTWEWNQWSQATTVTSLTIWSSPDWFRVDWNGNMWSWADTLINAQNNTFAVLKTGILYAKNAEISWNITITGGNTSLDNIQDWSIYKRVTSSEKTGAGRWYNALNSSNRYKNWLTASDMSSATLPTNWIVFWNQGIVWRQSWSTTFSIDTNWNAFFKWDIWASTITSGWYISIDQDVNNKLLMWFTSKWPGFQFLDTWTLVWELIWEYNKNITIWWSTVYIDCLSVSNAFYVGTDLVVQNNTVMWGNTLINWTLSLNNLQGVWWIEIDLYDNIDWNNNTLRRINLTNVWNTWVTWWELAIWVWNPTTIDPGWTLKYVAMDYKWSTINVVVKQ